MTLHTPMTGYACPVQSFLRFGGTVDELQSRFAISVKRHREHPNLVQFTYNQVESPFKEPIVQECRGLILDEQDGWRVIAWPFRKFFNEGEALAANLDWRTATVQEKLDGSLMILYWYKGAWYVATKGSPDAMGQVHATSMTFAELFWKTWREQGWGMPAGMDQHYTLMFELTSPFNRVVVSQERARLRLIGMRNIFTGAEMPIRLRGMYEPVRSFNLQSLEDIRATFETMSPLTQEGYVVVDGMFRRVKVKHPGYVALHHLRSSLSLRGVVEVVRTGETSEVLASFPEWKGVFGIVQAAYDALVTSLEQIWEDIKGVEPRKEFARLAAESPHASTLFALKDGHVSTVKDSLRAIHIDRLIGVLGVKGLTADVEAMAI